MSWKNILSHYLKLYFLLFLVITTVHGQAQWKFLIDVSGSMKVNDPENQRQKALEIIGNIAPENLDVGIIVFAKEPKSLMSMTKVDDSWQSLYEQQKGLIDYSGQWTDIGKSLSNTLEDWPNLDNRHVILVTDGVVDVSAHREENTQSRWHIFHHTLAKLQEKGIAVHTLSLGNQSDLELLQVLSQATEGFYRQVDKAEEIYDYLVDLMKIGTNYQQIPISEHSFKVDEKSQDIIIISPSAIAPLVLTPSKDTPDLNFQKAGNSFMAKISSPKPGPWQIFAEFQERPSVLTTSAIKMRWQERPTLVLGSDPFVVKAVIEGWSFEDDLPGRCEYSVDTDWKIEAQESSNPYLCQAQITPKFDKLEQQLTVSYFHPMFERVLEQRVQVFSQGADIEAQLSQDGLYWNLQVRPKIVFWDTDKLDIQADFTQEIDSFCELIEEGVYQCQVANDPALDTQYRFSLSGPNRQGVQSQWQSELLNLAYEPIVIPQVDTEDLQEISDLDPKKNEPQQEVLSVEDESQEQKNEKPSDGNLQEREVVTQEQSPVQEMELLSTRENDDMGVVTEVPPQDNVIETPAGDLVPPPAEQEGRVEEMSLMSIMIKQIFIFIGLVLGAIGVRYFHKYLKKKNLELLQFSDNDFKE